MTRRDLRFLCTALGFTAVVIRSEAGRSDDAQRALQFAALIEAFCINALGDVVDCEGDAATPIDTVIETMKSDLGCRGATDMQVDRVTLSKLYDRLRQRHERFASDDMIADRVLELLDAELRHETGLPEPPGPP